jgi:flagellar biosynthetic protein FliR
VYEVDASIIGGWVGSLIWPFIRISSFFMVAPVFGAQLVPMRIRIILSLLMSMIIAPHIPAVPIIDTLSVENVVIVAQQILIGIGMGFVLQFLLQMFVMAGQMIAMKMGLGFASMVDPTSGVSVPVVSQFHLLMVTLLFLVINGHLVMIDVLAASFYAIPIGGQ